MLYYVIQLALVGIAAGMIAGFFGVGGGIIIVPALIYFLHFEPHRAVGTSLAVLVPPIGLLAALAYYRLGYVDIKAAAIIAFFMVLAAYLGAQIANSFSSKFLFIAFGLFLTATGIYIIISNLK